MDRVFGIFGDLNQVKLGGGDSFSDHLSCKYTVSVLFLVSIMSTTRVFVDEPISCFCPSQFTSSQVSFTNKVCWTTNTHYVPYNRTHLPTETDPTKKYISYYQWIPLFLAFQAVFFYLPRCVWKKFSHKCGATVSHIVDACVECQRKSDNDSARKIMDYVIRYTGRFLVEFHSSVHSKNPIMACFSYINSNYLIELYLFVKLLYIGNVVGQLCLLNLFLGHDYHMYGYEVLNKLISNKPWTTSHRFPRVAICDLHLRVLGNVQRHTVQCALPMNLFYEIIFIFLWFWFVFVAVASTISFFAWALTSFVPWYQTRYVRRRLFAMEKVEMECCDQVGQFVRNHLRMDGCFLLHMAASNSNDLIVSDLLAGLWDQYCYIQNKKGPYSTIAPLKDIYSGSVVTSLLTPRKEIEIDEVRKSIRKREERPEIGFKEECISNSRSH